MFHKNILYIKYSYSNYKRKLLSSVTLTFDELRFLELLFNPKAPSKSEN